MHTQEHSALSTLPPRDTNVLGDADTLMRAPRSGRYIGLRQSISESLGT